MSDDLSRSVQGMQKLEAAMARFIEASTAARQRVSDATWVDLVAFREAHPDEVTLDDIIEIHNNFAASLDSLAAPFPGLAQTVKAQHRETIDKMLDAKNEGNK